MGWQAQPDFDIMPVVVLRAASLPAHNGNHHQSVERKTMFVMQEELARSAQRETRPAVVFGAQMPGDSLPLSLTRREADIVRLVAADLCNKQIADRLQISEWTVGTHMRRIFAKLGVRSRAAMVFRALSATEGRLLA